MRNLFCFCEVYWFGLPKYSAQCHVCPRLQVSPSLTTQNPKNKEPKKKKSKKMKMKKKKKKKKEKKSQAKKEKKEL